MKDAEVELNEFFYAWKVLEDNIGKHKVIRVGNAISKLLLIQASFIPNHISSYLPMRRRMGIKEWNKIIYGELGICFGQIIVVDNNLKDWSFRLENENNVKITS